MSHFRYRPEVDGLRAIAILPVVLFHAGLPGFSGGFVGVDVFFVISGYLITSIILAEKEAGTFSIANFYARRIRRIFPALFLTILVTYPLALWVLGPGAMEEFSGSVIASALFYSNWFFLQHSGYFALDADLKPLLHTWSLAVEEQYYMVFPLLFLLTWRLGRNWQIAIFSGLAAISLALAQVTLTHMPEAAFFLLPMRFWELMVGAVCAYVLASPRYRSLPLLRPNAFLGLAGLLLIAIAVVSYNGDTPFPGLTALLPCAGACLVILFAHAGTVPARLLSTAPAVALGLVSYSFYLWHFPLLAFARQLFGPNLPILLATCVLALLLATLSWKYVEQPVRRSRTLTKSRAFGFALVSITAASALGWAGASTQGYKAFYIEHRLNTATRANYDRYFKDTVHKDWKNDPENCVFDSQDFNGDFSKRFDACAASHGRGLLLIGDSHAGNIFRALQYSGRFPFIASVWQGGCRPHKPKADCPYEPAKQFIAERADKIQAVVLQLSGSHFILDHLGEDDSMAAFTEGNRATFDADNVDKTIAYLNSLPQPPAHIWLGPFAEARVEFDKPENFSPERLRFNPVALRLFGQLNELLKEKTAGGPLYVSLVDALKFNSDSLLAGGCMTFSDRDHLSDCGEALFADAIADALANALSQPQAGAQK